MADARNEEVLGRVRELLDKYPELNSRQLHDMAARMDTSLAAMPLRSFHARYVLPIKRARSAAASPPKPKRAAKTARTARARQRKGEARPAAEQRSRIHGVLYRLARDVAAADTRADLVDVLARIDAYVDDIVASAD